MSDDMELDVDNDQLSILESKESTHPEEAIKGYLAIVNNNEKATTDDARNSKEFAYRHLAELYVKRKEVQGLAELVRSVRTFLDQVSKAKGGQLFRFLFDKLSSFSDDMETQIKLCNESIEWAKEEKRTFLRQSLEVRLLSLYLDSEQFQNCLAQVAPLLKELKRLDDKALLVDVQLMESKAYFALGNYPKSKASLVSARTTANGIYCPPKMQAELDLQSGVTHGQEKDFKTAASYFYEAFEGFDSVDMKDKAILGLKYMLLGKVVLQEAKDVAAVISGKLALRYAGRDLEAMQAVATASMKRSLKDFEAALNTFPKELKGDRIIAGHLNDLYDSLLEDNLARIVEPFSRVEIAHIAKVIERSKDVVEGKLSQMILDKKLSGILDQNEGCLEIFAESSNDKTFDSTLETIQNMNGVVKALSKRAQKIV